jgi:hypothetical protein
LKDEDHKNRANPKGSIELKSVSRDIALKGMKNLSTILINPSYPTTITIPINGRMWEIVCESRYQTDMWVGVIARQIMKLHNITK